MFAMEKVEGQQLWQNRNFLVRTATSRRPVGISVVSSIAQFIVEFHNKMESCGLIPATMRKPPANDEALFKDRIAKLNPVVALPIKTLWNHSKHSMSGDREAPCRFVHMDLHPANILLDGSDRIGVVDFGRATYADPHSEIGKLIVYYGPQFGRDLTAKINSIEPSWALDYNRVVLCNSLYLSEKIPQQRNGAKKAALAYRSWHLALETKRKTAGAARCSTPRQLPSGLNELKQA